MRTLQGEWTTDVVTLVFQTLWDEVRRQNVKVLQAAAISPYLTSSTPVPTHTLIESLSKDDVDDIENVI